MIISVGNNTIRKIKAEINQSQLSNYERKGINKYLNDYENARILDQIENQYLKEHEEFTKALAVLHPGLTVNNVKLCIFIKLGLTVKEIAQLTYKSPESIKVAKNRLKKKLNITPSTKLFTYLLNIEHQ